MKRIGAILLLLAAGASAQTAPTITGLKIRADFAIRTGGPAARAQGASRKSVCASAPFTADSQVFSVLLELEPQMSGLTPAQGVPGIFTDTGNPPRTLYFVTAMPFELTSLHTQRRDYPVTVRRINELWIENLTWADASDIFAELQSAPDLITGPIGEAIISTGGISYTFLKVALPAPAPGATGAAAHPDQVLLNELANEDKFNFTPSRWAQTIETLKSMTTLKAIAGATITTETVKTPVTAPANLQITSNASTAASDLQAVIGANGTNGRPGVGSAPPNRILIVDSPCLSVAVLPALTGSNVTGGTLTFAGRYLFPFQAGHSFARTEISGSSPLNGNGKSTFSKLGVVFDVGINKDQQANASTAPLRYTGGLTATYDHNTGIDGVTTSKAAGGLKGSIQFPVMMGLAGDDARPTLTFEGVGATTQPQGGTSSSQFEANAKFKSKFRWTPAYASSIDARFLLSKDAIYGNRKNNYLITVDLLKMLVRDPLEFTATWKCGRPEPDYARVCGFYAGFSFTSNQ